MNIASASSRQPHRWYFCGLVSLALLAGAGCQEGFVKVPSLDDVHNPMGSWSVDPSTDTASAFIVPTEAIGDGSPTSGQTLTDAIYPKLDDDFWKITVSEPGQLVVATLTYAAATSTIRLAMDWIGPRGLCVPQAPASCRTSPDCDSAAPFCDLQRGGCRAALAPACTDASQCGSGEACVVGAEELITSVVEVGQALQHRLVASLPAHAIGDYYLRVYDRSGTVGDADAPYELRIGALLDIDAAEANDGPNAATSIGSGVAAEGALSFNGDVDWFRIDPTADLGITTPAVVSVELRWPRNALVTPVWTLTQGEREFATTRLPRTETDAVVTSATWVMPDAGPLMVRVDAPDGSVDHDNAYELSVRVAADSNEGAARNDIVQQATVFSATSFGTVHQASHTLIAENDADWYRIDRASGTNPNTLLHLRATASSDDIMLSLMLYERAGSQTCNPSTQQMCGAADLACVCPFSGTCGAGQGVCLRPWVMRPLPNDPNDPPEFGGRTPNQLDLNVPMFVSGPGAVWLRIGHLQQVVPPRAGFSASDPYTLLIEHLQEPDTNDRNADASEYFPLPLGVSEGSFRSEARPLVVGGLGATASGYISYEGDQDWFQFSAGGVGVAQARVVFSSVGGGSLDLRVQVLRGGSRVGDYVGGGGVALDPGSECTHMYDDDSTILVWVNDDNFDDRDVGQPYSFTLDLVPGCDVPPCALCRCQPDQGCGCGEPPPNECGSCDGSVTDQGCGCGEPAPVDGNCG
jgi:hypothetical protein